MESKTILTVDVVILTAERKERVKLTLREGQPGEEGTRFQLHETRLELTADKEVLRAGDRVEVTLRKL